MPQCPAFCAQLVAGAPGALGARPENSFVGLYISLFKLLRPGTCLRDGHAQHCADALDPRHTADVSRDGPVFCCDPHLGEVSLASTTDSKNTLASCLPGVNYYVRWSWLGPGSVSCSADPLRPVGQKRHNVPEGNTDALPGDLVLQLLYIPTSPVVTFATHNGDPDPPKLLQQQHQDVHLVFITGDGAQKRGVEPLALSTMLLAP